MCVFLGMQSPRIGLIPVLEGVVFHISGQSASLGQLLYILTFSKHGRGVALQKAWRINTCNVENVVTQNMRSC